MHSFTGPQGTVFSYNSDFSGDIGINEGGCFSKFIEVPFEDLQAFLLERRRAQFIGNLENMSYEELENYRGE